MSALRHIKTVNASGVNGVTLDNVFTSDFDVYKITIDNLLSNVGNWGNVRLTQADGRINNPSNYNYMKREFSNTSAPSSRATSQSKMDTAFYWSTTTGGGACLYVANPTRTDRTIIMSDASSGTTSTITSNYTYCSIFNQNVYTGIHLFCSNTSATITDATVSVFGYVKDL